MEEASSSIEATDVPIQANKEESPIVVQNEDKYVHLQ